MTYKVICAWCGVTLRTGAEVKNSHGICEACKKRIMEEYEKSRQSATAD